MPFHAKLAAFMALFLALAPAVAKAQDGNSADKVEMVASLWCDTPDQLETVLRAHYTDKVPMAEAMADINRLSPEACIFARAIVSPGSEIRRLTAGDKIMALRQASVLGIMRGQYALMMRPQTWYYVQVVAELTPL